jgi:DNA-binding MarR family transcriptional regulator
MSRQSIKEEIKQTRPFRSRSQEAVIALLRTAHLLRRRFEAITEREGITSQQYNVLRILRGAKTPLPTMEISSRMIETSCGITRLITTLEEKGLVRREQWEGDRRHMLCQITPSGLRLLERLDDDMNGLDESAAGSIDDATLDLFTSTLSEIRHSVSSEET